MASEAKLYTIALELDDPDSLYNVRATPEEMEGLVQKIADAQGLSSTAFVERFEIPILSVEELRQQINEIYDIED